MVNLARAGMIRSEQPNERGNRSKPRASGDDPRIVRPSQAPEEVNPARAGMIPVSALLTPSHIGKPRASGDDPPGASEAAAPQP